MSCLLSSHWVLVAAVWYFGNGVLHDIFVLKNHQSRYDRELLRLLMDGHVLMLSGALAFVCYRMLLLNNPFGAVIGTILGAGMVIYCALIFPFLKSFVTLAISIILMIVSLNALTGISALFSSLHWR